jgi:hypothetical protein
LIGKDSNHAIHHEIGHFGGGLQRRLADGGGQRERADDERMQRKI